MKNIEKTARESLNNGDLLKAGFLYKDALKENMGKPNSKEETKRLKKDLIDLNKKIIDPQNKVFKEVEVATDVSKIQVIFGKFIDDLISKDITLILKVIGAHPHFKVNYAQVLATSKKTMPLSMQLGAIATYSTEGHIIPGSTNGEHNWQVEMYEINLELINKLLLIPLFEQLIKNKILNKKNLLKYFIDSKLLQEENLPFVEQGIDKFFKKDYISFLHIMIPQFENIFLKISGDLGIDIIATDKSAETRTKILSSQCILSEEFTKIWGEDYCRRIDHILFEPLGLKLRHKIAHGEILVEECTFENSLAVLYLYLVLLAIVKKVPIEL